MKRKISKILFFFGIVQLFITNVKSFELKYSEWSEIYPENINEILIEREDRFLWYKENESDVEYLIKENIGDKLYDENDIQYYESEETLEKPIEYSERVINTNVITKKYSKGDIKGVVVNTTNGGEVSEIVVYNNFNQRVECISENNYLNDNIFDVYYSASDGLSCYFEDKQGILNLTVFVYLTNSNPNEDVSIDIRLVASDNVTIFIKSTSYRESNTFIQYKGQYFDDLTWHDEIYYSYIDKLYKSYNINKEYESEYYSNLDGYIKDESTKKTFYRYITNDYIILDENDNIVSNEDYCIKEFCRLIYITKEPEEIPENPQTYDGICNYIILLTNSLIVLIVKICHTIKKSSFVESI